MFRSFAGFLALVVSIGSAAQSAWAQQASAISPAAWEKAKLEADIFQRAFKAGGMTGVAEDIDRCYKKAMQIDRQIAVRDCLVYDAFADRFAAQMNRQANLPIPPYFQAANVYPRWSKYSGPAGFTDAQIMSGYLGEGSNLIFTVIAQKARAGQ